MSLPAEAVLPLDAFLLPAVGGGCGFGVVVTVGPDLCFVRLQNGIEGSISPVALLACKEALRQHCGGDAA